ncbi:meckelin [Diachasma alloeum]|uniref:meckelin n=1 Tax=Diachasma alloeum TaxID=454923 RepID=UPI0007384DBE|nr:meckelin [Diachasma alloeum]
MWGHGGKRVVIVGLIYFWALEQAVGNDPQSLDSFVIPFTDPRDCSLRKCFDATSGVCKSPGTCSNELRNETLGKWSDCSLLCPSTDKNCRTIVDNNHETEIEDSHYVLTELSQTTRSHCSLRDDKSDSRVSNDSCLPSATGIRNYCLHRNTSSNWQDLRSNYLIDFSNRSIDSYYLRRELRFVVAWCGEGDAGACEHLSNICVLTLKAESFPCQLFLGETPPRRLFWAVGNAKGILERRGIPNKFKLSNKDSQNNRLNFIFAKYSLRGAFRSYSDWISPCSFFKNVRFGINGDKICWTSAKELIDLRTTFYVPYLSFISNDNKNKYLYPLPVLVKNETLDMKDTSKWVLTSKFFMVDKVTGAGVSVAADNFSTVPEIEILRYVKSLTIQVRAQERKERGKIFPPLIILEYGELTQDDVEKNVEIPIEYRIVFKLTEKTTNLWIKVGMGVASGLSLIYAIFCTFSHYRRNNNSVPILKSLGWFLIYYCGAFGTDLLIISTSVCLSAFIFYKGQTVLHILLPTENTEKLIKICAIAAFSSKTIEIIALVFQLRSTNVFFIDWETPRCINSPASYDSPHTSLKKSYNQRFRKDSGNSQRPPSEAIASRRNKTPSKSSQASTPSRHSTGRDLEALDQFSPNYIDANFSLDEHDIKQNSTVSMWRTYVIANEWIKMKTKRKINLSLHVFGTLFFLEVLGLKNWALAIPSLKPPHEQMDFVKESFTLKIAVGALTYLLLYSLQLLTSVLYTRYYKNRLHGFVDLCSVANISIFILTHEYYGYYIHGRSVHGFADTDLLTVIKDLKREEDNLCAHRGLIPGTTDQTFVLCVSKTFKSFYDSVAMRDPNERKFSRKHAVGLPNWEERWKTHLTIKKFLAGFLDHCFKNVEYTIKERHLMEKLLDTEFMDSSRDKSIFYIDKKYSFDQAIFYGNEWALATFEASVFVLILAFGGSYVFSAVTTIFLSSVIELAVKFDMKKNLASKTLIDERFLLS